MASARHSPVCMLQWPLSQSHSADKHTSSQDPMKHFRALIVYAVLKVGDIGKTEYHSTLFQIL